MTAAAPLSQLNYKETPYEDQGWPVIGSFSENPQFEAIEIPIISAHEEMTDPMFADFGGRLHAAQGSAWKSAPGATKEKEQEQKEDPRLIKMLPENLEALKKAAFEEGKRIAREEAAEENVTKLAALEKNISEVMQDLANQVAEHLREIERNSVQLAVQISEKIIGYGVEISPEYIGKLVHEALRHVGSAAVRSVHVSKQDYEFIEVVGLPKTLVELDGTWKFVADDTVRAGCVVHTSAGEIDFKLDAAWERMRESIVKAIT